MAHITKVTFPKAHNNLRKGFTHGTHGAIHALIADKKSGDAIQVTLDDGTTESYKLVNAQVNGDQLTVSLAPGVES